MPSLRTIDSHLQVHALTVLLEKILSRSESPELIQVAVAWINRFHRAY